MPLISICEFLVHDICYRKLLLVYQRRIYHDTCLFNFMMISLLKLFNLSALIILFTSQLLVLLIFQSKTLEKASAIIIETVKPDTFPVFLFLFLPWWSCSSRYSWGGYRTSWYCLLNVSYTTNEVQRHFLFLMPKRADLPKVAK